jgi:hypothetical protein
MKAKELPTQEYLNECLTYDPETGLLYWKTRPLEHFVSQSAYRTWNTRFAGKRAFDNNDSDGYKIGALLGVKWKAHRIIYKMIHGIDPDIIDHGSGDVSDNRIDKLSNSDEIGNGRNQKLRSTNKSGIMGVYWHTALNKWRAQIRGNGKTIHLGYFDSLEEAAAVRKAAEVELGYHPNHGRDLQTVTF